MMDAFEAPEMHRASSDETLVNDNDNDEKSRRDAIGENSTDSMGKIFDSPPPEDAGKPRTSSEVTLTNNTNSTKSEGSSTPNSTKDLVEPTRPAYEKLAQKRPRPMDHPSITLGLPIIILFDLIVPCIIYYTWYNNHRRQWIISCDTYITHNETCPHAKPEFDTEILGYAIISFGFGELYILIARVYRLFTYPDDCAPLLSRSRYDLDATSWVYAVSMVCALIPFVVGSTLTLPRLYLYAPSFLMAFLGVLMVATLLPLRLPVGINSHTRGERLRPFIYYAAEDFVAVDGLQDRAFRVRYNRRYEQSARFRRLFLHLTLWWILGVCVYIGVVSVVIWTLEFHYAFGLSLGVLFSYIVIWAAVSYLWVNVEMGREKREFERMGVC